jgi:hypothetical protein
MEAFEDVDSRMSVGEEAVGNLWADRRASPRLAPPFPQ